MNKLTASQYVVLKTAKLSRLYDNTIYLSRKFSTTLPRYTEEDWDNMLRLLPTSLDQESEALGKEYEKILESMSEQLPPL